MPAVTLTRHVRKLVLPRPQTLNPKSGLPGQVKSTEVAGAFAPVIVIAALDEHQPGTLR
jgi:hypothetical protein